MRKEGIKKGDDEEGISVWLLFISKKIINLLKLTYIYIYYIERG
jgi:hypothetical protein